MFSRGKTIVIPNEDEILQDIFEREVAIGKTHNDVLQEFSDTFMLGFHFTAEDYQTAPSKITKRGHLVIKTDEDSKIVICYLPERITDRQLSWLTNNTEMLNKYVQINAFSIKEKIENKTRWQRLYGLSDILKVAKQKNLLPEKGMEK